MPSIGPTLPPHLRRSDDGPVTIHHVEVDEDECEDDFGPALPPHLAAARRVPTAGPSRPTSTTLANSATAGPSRPPSAPTQPSSRSRETSPPARRAKAPNPYGDDSDGGDDDGYQVGPSLGYAAGPSGRGSAADEFREREARWAREREEAAKPKELKREEWMLVPPKNSTLAETLGDPLKIKARGFARSAEDAPRERDQTLWTETPAQRQQRLQDEMMGKKRKAEDANNVGDAEAELDDAKRRRRDEEIKASVRSHNSRHRAAPMVDIHSQSKSKSSHSAPGRDTNGKQQKDPDEPPPIWDRDLHMGVTGKLMQDKDRMKMLKDAKNLGDRFGKGSYA